MPMFLREMISFTAERLIELESSGPDRRGARGRRRIGWRSATATAIRDWATRAGTVELRIPSSGRAATSLASWSRGGWRRRPSPRVMRRPTCRAYSTRGVDELVKALGMAGISKSQ